MVLSKLILISTYHPMTFDSLTIEVVKLSLALVEMIEVRTFHSNSGMSFVYLQIE